MTPPPTTAAAPKWMVDLIASEIGDALSEESCHIVTPENVQNRALACANYIVARLNDRSPNAD